MGKLAHEAEYLATLTIEKIARSLSAKDADRFGSFLGRVGYKLISSRRHIALDNLKQSFKERYNEQEYDQICRAVFEGFGRTFIELSRFGIINKNNLSEYIANNQGEIIKEAIAHGKGLIVLTAHYGNFEMVGLWSGSHGIDASILIPTHSNRKVDRKLIAKRNEVEVGVIQIPHEVKKVFKHLKENKILGMIADQHAPSGNIIMDFFGRPAAMAKGAALFSIRTGAPILPVVLRRENYNKHVLTTAPLIFPTAHHNEEDYIKQIITRYNQFFEAEITKHPEQWLWTHRRWKV